MTKRTALCGSPRKMMPAEASTPDSTSLSSSIFIVDERDYQRDPLIKMPKFDGNEPKYYCGCCCHVWVCTLMVGVMELIFLVLNLIFTAAAYGTEKIEDGAGINSIFIFLRSEESLTTGIIAALIGFTVVGLLVHGVLKQRHRFLLPHLTVQFSAILICLLAAVLFAISSVAMSHRFEYNQNASVPIGRHEWTYAEKLFNRRLAYRQCVSISVVLTCLSAVQLTFFVAVLRCYFYLREVRRRVESASYLPMVAVKAGVSNA